jgi:surface antigen
MSRELKIKPPSKRILAITLLCAFVVIIIAALTVIVVHYVNKPVDCSKLLATTKSAQTTKSQKTYNQLKTQAKTCAAVPAKSQKTKAQISKAKVQAVTYDVAVMNAALRNNDRPQAFASANQALTTLKTMSDTELNQIPNRNSVVLEVISIHTMQKNYGPQK